MFKTYLFVIYYLHLNIQKYKGFFHLLYLDLHWANCPLSWNVTPKEVSRTDYKYNRNKDLNSFGEFIVNLLTNFGERSLFKVFFSLVFSLPIGILFEKLWYVPAFTEQIKFDQGNKTWILWHTFVFISNCAIFLIYKL